MRQLLFLTALVWPAASAAANGAEAIPTFHSMGLYWTPASGGSPSTECAVSWRTARQWQWNRGQPLWFDRRTGQYRGSVVHLRPGTAYVFRLQLSTGEHSEVTQSTWAEELSVARRVSLPRAVSSAMLTIREGGSPGAYVLYEANPAGTTIDIANAEEYCIDIQGSYVIVRGVVCKGARRHGIHIANQHDVVIEGCDISGWGGRKRRRANTRIRPISECTTIPASSATAVTWSAL